MFRLMPSVLFILLLFFFSPEVMTGLEQKGDVKRDDQTFVLDSINYTTNGKSETSKFKDGSVQIRADSVKNEITIQGSYGPGDPKVSTVEVDTDPVTSLTPKFENGKWSATIEANKLQTNRYYNIKPIVKVGVSPAPAKLFIALN